MSNCVHARRRFGWVRAVGPLSVTILSIAITSIFRLYDKPHNIRIVGSIPQVGAGNLPLQRARGNPEKVEGTLTLM